MWFCDSLPINWWNFLGCRLKLNNSRACLIQFPFDPCMSSERWRPAQSEDLLLWLFVWKDYCGQWLLQPIAAGFHNLCHPNIAHLSAKNIDSPFYKTNYTQHIRCRPRVTWTYSLKISSVFVFCVCNCLTQQNNFVFFSKLQDITCPLTSTNCGRWLRPVCVSACSWSGSRDGFWLKIEVRKRSNYI